MTSKNRHIKGIESLLVEIDIHLDKFTRAYTAGDFHLAQYYQKEIYRKFWLQVAEKSEKYAPLPGELKEKILSSKIKVYENKSISWNETL